VDNTILYRCLNELRIYIPNINDYNKAKGIFLDYIVMAYKGCPGQGRTTSSRLREPSAQEQSSSLSGRPLRRIR
jgi:hypothetical protein